MLLFLTDSVVEGTLNSGGIENRSVVFSKGFGAVKLSRKSIKVIVGVNILVLILYMSLNVALSDLNRWCQDNSLTPHSGKCEAMLLMKKTMVGPLNSVNIGWDRIKWVNYTRLLGVTTDDRLSWSQHLIDVKKSFANKLNLIKKSSFLGKKNANAEQLNLGNTSPQNSKDDLQSALRYAIF